MAQSNQYRNYSKNIFTVLIIGCVTSLVLFIGPFALIGSINDNASGHSFLVQNDWLGTLSGIGLLILLVEIIGVMVYDWRGVITLRGAVKSHVMRKGKLVSTSAGFVLLYLFLPEIMLPIYLIRAAIDYRQAAQRKPLELKQQIAVMEAQLGILPPSHGTCRACNKPLQVGAEFCQYCGEPVIERPKVCPSCATTTFSDAKWCPKCRTALP
jgi:Double zinc ribbon